MLALALAVPALWAAAIWVCHDQAKVKGRDLARWTWASVFLGVVAAAVILGLPPKCLQPRACPSCLGIIPGAATRCRHCGGEVEAIPAPAPSSRQPRQPRYRAQHPPWDAPA